MRLSALTGVCTVGAGVVLVGGALPGALAVAVPPSLDCHRVSVDGYTYDLSPLNKYCIAITVHSNRSHWR